MDIVSPLNYFLRGEFKMVVQPIRNLEVLKEFTSRFKDRNRLMVEMGLRTGLRISDIIKLKVEDVYNGHGVKEYIHIKEEKTEKSNTLIISDKLKPMIEEHIKKNNLQDTDYLFKSRKGSKHITPTQSYRVIDRVVKDMKLENIGTHSLRKSFGYHFYNTHKDVALLQSILNHSSPQETLLYIGVHQDKKDQSMNAMPF